MYEDYKDFDEAVISKIIVLSDLKDYTGSKFNKYYVEWIMQRKKEKENPNKSQEQIEAEIKEEIKSNINKFLKESRERDYQIDEEKNKELEKTFKQIKLKINFDSKPKILRDGKFYTFSKGNFCIYDDKFYNKLYEIKLEENFNFISAIQLDNKDIVLLSSEELVIFRLINEKYDLFQKIRDNRAGYRMQKKTEGLMRFPKYYKPQNIKEISGNRFILINNYGFKIYSLNEKNEYSIILLETYYNGLELIIELDKDNFIFCSKIECGPGVMTPPYNVIKIDKIKLREMTIEEKEEKLKRLDEKDYYEDDNYYGLEHLKPVEKLSKVEVKNVVESLKYTCQNQELLNYSTYDERHYFRGNAILKNRYYIIAIDHNILVFDILSGKQLIRYEILVLVNGKDNLFKFNANLKKWNNKDDNEFLLNCGENFILLELNNDMELKIISQSYLNDVKSLKKLNENKNDFYDEGESCYYNKSKDNIYSISIFN